MFNNAVKILMGISMISFLSFSKGEISFQKQLITENSKKIEIIENNEKDNAIKNSRDREEKIRYKIVEFAKTQIGKPYVYGATGNNSFDCSSFVQYVFKKTLGITIPRVSAEQSIFKPKLHNNIKKGDLLFFETLEKGRISHVGMYIGNRQFIHASSKSKRVTVSQFAGFYQEKFRWAVSII
ncbi:cell wall-associated hydrolase [Leptotrichia trevisanii]|uniref:Cell wall-associated hydrolase n=1 Tax=Leptotrichia trevisanii TaxID=109328 RepID=A0A510JXQ4_9FUSO|nr:C40 family peptidase [Leptotrichia trevisanii]BBM44159.1 cell wall-associated hydrolase [Leptotrichia trevisanii]BBM51304.1 cell wall-associated hydrolase [Leptotrichia trevisanii]